MKYVTSGCTWCQGNSSLQQQRTLATEPSSMVLISFSLNFISVLSSGTSRLLARKASVLQPAELVTWSGQRRARQQWEWHPVPGGRAESCTRTQPPTWATARIGVTELPWSGGALLRCTFLRRVRYLLREVFMPSADKMWVRAIPCCNTVFLMNETSSLLLLGISICRIPKDFAFIQYSLGYSLPSQYSFQKGNSGS